MERENQRVALTKARLRGALVRLIQTRPLHRVSIRELCGEAGINRTTFYNHYGSQYELVEDISRGYLEDVARCLHAADPTSRESVGRRVALVLTYMADNMALTALLVNNSADPAFAERLFSLQQITELLDAALAGETDARKKAATVSFAIHGSYRLLQEWVNDPARIPPEEQAALMLRLARRVCGA